ncbi:biopolymer transporter ExbD [Flavobacterium sp. MAH-1]|uniref:Biopolymer transporter ExbD n=1 Tax=Flavobacterium agri TaxID=2743471 RepID=A0A7Y8Y4X8_9FLAO|nr:biopolymer transporter ExbD [Flavobacterium agri]NUY82436.1 biopolymer transporter ExbD [Flavobacterium agri]NYA72460.1 biopolymer transporter ExbD [Flavobacterium agri]
MAIKRKRRFHPELFSASMSDIMFFLFLFFLIISTLANPNVIKLTLPKAESTETTKKDHLTLSVTPEKHYFLNKEEVPFDQLEMELAARVQNSGDKNVVIRIPADLQVQDLVDLMQIGVKLKLNFVIATAKN